MKDMLNCGRWMREDNPEGTMTEEQVEILAELVELRISRNVRFECMPMPFAIGHPDEEQARKNALSRATKWGEMRNSEDALNRKASRREDETALRPHRASRGASTSSTGPSRRRVACARC